MKKTWQKAVVASLLPAIPMLVTIFNNFIARGSGWSTMLIQYHTIFWLPRILLAPFLIMITARLWKRAASPHLFVGWQVVFFFIYNLLCWGLSFIACPRLAMSFDGRLLNLFNTIRYESSLFNLLFYLATTTLALSWLYFENRKAEENRVSALKQSLEYTQLALSGLQHQLTKPTITTVDSFPVKNGIKTILVPLMDINYFESKGNYVKIVTEKGSYLVKKTLAEIQKALPVQFRRVHRSSIVNIACVGELRSLLNGDTNLVLKSGHEIRSSRTYRENLKDIACIS